MYVQPENCAFVRDVASERAAGAARSLDRAGAGAAESRTRRTGCRTGQDVTRTLKARR